MDVKSFKNSANYTYIYNTYIAIQTLDPTNKDVNMTNQTTNHFIDAKGLKCPMPVIKLQQQVRKSETGEVIAIDCTDPGAEKDISSWAKVNKHKIEEVIETDFGCRILLKVKPKA